MRVLAADDDPIQLEAMRAWLSRLPAQVVTADNGDEAWNLLSQQDFDLAVIDLHMPKLDGFGLINWLRQTPRTVDLPILVVTSRNDDAAIDQAYAAGASSFTTKPVNWQLFLHQARFVMRAGQNERAIRAERLQQQAVNAEKDEVLRLISQSLEAAPSAPALGQLAEDLGLLQRCFSGMAEPSPCAMDGLVSTIVAKAQARLGAGGIHVMARESLEAISASIDAALACEALVRLCEEIARAAAGGSAINVSAHIDEAGALMISALCAGADGLPASFGLSLARQVAGVHGGEFLLHASPGEGVAAVLKFPAAQARQSPRASAQSLKLRVSA